MSIYLISLLISFGVVIWLIERPTGMRKVVLGVLAGWGMISLVNAIMPYIKSIVGKVS